jgi:ABC-type transporter Mla MlaB component
MDPIIRKKKVEGGWITAWEGYLTIQYVSLWKERFSQLTIEPGSNFSLDLNKIQRIDTAGIQFLIFLKHHCIKNQIHLHLLNHPLPILKVFDVLGLVGFFGDRIKVNKELSAELAFAYGTKKETIGSF